MKIKFICLLLAILFIPLLSVGSGPDRFQEIDNKKPRYLKRKSDAWKKSGRLIGEVKHTPAHLPIKAKNVGTDKVIYTYTPPAKLSLYQTKHLPPGRYDFTVESEGFLPHTIKNIKIKARSDCMINIIFGLRVYDNSL